MKMKKYLIILFILSLLVTTFKTYYVEADEDDNIITINSEVYLNSTIDINIDINKIEYNKFIFKLVSNNTLNNVELSSEENIDLNVTNDSLSFEYDKENSNLTSLILKYNLPLDSKIGDTITYNISIINADNEEELITFEKEIKIVEQKQDSKTNTQSNSNNQNNKPTTGNQPNNQNNKQNMNNRTNNGTSTTSQNKSQVQTKQTNNQTANNIVQVTYNGSDNNYLKSLSISGYKLNKTFSKDNSTYFVTVPDNTKKLTIKATADNSNSIVKINGNDKLSSGLNKILITVYAENGNTRVYRIYVNVGSSNE